MAALAHVAGHNMETVRRLTIRTLWRSDRSLDMLREIITIGITAKTRLHAWQVRLMKKS